jgi:type I restriction enzyme S subunit
MNAQQLKNAILQEAITGRLVPQDPNDEPASVLLDKIRKEKAKLVKEGKLKKKDLEEKPISKEEIPFEIPESWEWVRIKDVFTINPKVIADDNADAAFIPME